MPLSRAQRIPRTMLATTAIASRSRPGATSTTPISAPVAASGLREGDQRARSGHRPDEGHGQGVVARVVRDEVTRGVPVELTDDYNAQDAEVWYLGATTDSRTAHSSTPAASASSRRRALGDTDREELIRVR